MGSIVCLIGSGTHTYEVIPGPHGDILVLGKKAGKQIIASGWHNITLRGSRKNGPSEWCWHGDLNDSLMSDAEQV